MLDWNPLTGGDFWVNAGSKIVYLPQQPDIVEDHTVLEQVFADAGEKNGADSRIRRHFPPHCPRHRPSRCSDVPLIGGDGRRFDAADAWDLETNAKVILSKLGIEDFDARIGDLSGGYRKRVAIAAALLADPDALLMDEPTKTTWIAGSVEWLAELPQRFSRALLLDTHDR